MYKPKHLPFLFLALLGFGLALRLPAQPSTDKSNIDKMFEATQNLRTGQANLEKQQREIRSVVQQTSVRLDSLERLFRENADALLAIDSSLHKKEQLLSNQIQVTQDDASHKIEEVRGTFKRTSLYWILAFLLMALALVLVFFGLRKRLSLNQASVIGKIESTRRQLEAEAIRLDEKLVGVMEAQLKLFREERQASSASDLPADIDHSLALKVADEIVRIQKNISLMDAGTKGLKQLSKAVERIRDNFAANGYEMVEMVGKPYNEGMKLIANFIVDESLPEGVRVITRIIKPQVNYKGIMIQSAQVEISQGV